MKQFLAFVRKEFYHIFRDRRTVLIVLGMPVVEIILFGFAITTEVKNVKVAVLDPSKDVYTQRLTERFEASEYFTVVRQLDSPAEIERAFQRGEINLALIFGDNFDGDLLHSGAADIQLVADATDPNMASMTVNYASAIVNAFQQELALNREIPMQIVPEVKLLYNPQMKSAYTFVPGVMGLILMLICAMMTAISIVREKEMGTMEVLLVSPVKPIFIIISKAVPYLALSCINLITILLLSVFVLGVPVAGSLFWLSVVSILFITVALGLGLLISSITRTQVTAMLISGMGMMMPVMLLSGMIFPVESMPAVLQGISWIIPARWYIAAVKKLMIEGVDVVYVLKELSILLGMAVVLITMNLKIFKDRLE